MFDHLIDWLRLTLPEHYEISDGLWLDHPAVADKFICSLHGMGGAAPVVDTRRPRYRILLLGPANGRQHAREIRADAEALAACALGDSVPCGAAAIKATGEPAGPGYTAESRPWFSLDLEIIY